jgi:hypothetical protein
MNIASKRTVTDPAVVKRVKVEYLGIIEALWRVSGPVQYVDDFGRSELELPFRDEIVSCFQFSLPYPNPSNTMSIAICNITEMRLTPPTPTQQYWRVGFSHSGYDDLERQNEFITSGDSAKQLFDEWYSRH